MSYMDIAIEEARKGINNGDGGPFGAVIVKSGVPIASDHNHVVSNNDPTAHGEISCIRDACKKLNTFDLTGCTLYTTGEPCDMCLCACMWANIDHIYYGCTIEENSLIGFRDLKFDGIFEGRDKLKNFMTQVDHDKCLEVFNEYSKMNSVKY